MGAHSPSRMRAFFLKRDPLRFSVQKPVAVMPAARRFLPIFEVSTTTNWLSRFTWGAYPSRLAEPVTNRLSHQGQVFGIGVFRQHFQQIFSGRHGTMGKTIRFKQGLVVVGDALSPVDPHQSSIPVVALLRRHVRHQEAVIGGQPGDLICRQGQKRKPCSWR